MPHHYYRHTIRSEAGDPIEVTFGDGSNAYADTASSEDAIVESFGHEHDGAHEEGGARQLVAYARFSSPAARAGRPSVLLQGQRKPRPLLKRKKRLGACAEDSLTRELTPSSGTVVAVTIAAEISLRALGRLENDLLSVSALEEFTTVLTARRTVSAFYACLNVAKDIGFLRERDVDPQTARFSGRPEEWNEKRFKLQDYVVLNEVAEPSGHAAHGSEPHETKPFVFSPENVDAWLEDERPVLARVHPRDLEGIEWQVKPCEGGPDVQHAVVIIGKDDDRYIVLTGWKGKGKAKARIKRTAASEAWGLLFEGDYGGDHG